MQIDITGHHVDLSDALRSYVNEKLERLERHFDNATAVHVILSVEKQRHRAEANLQVSGASLHADTTQDDMYAAIDDLIDKLDRQVKKHKEKLTERRRTDASLKSMPPE